MVSVHHYFRFFKSRKVHKKKLFVCAVNSKSAKRKYGRSAFKGISISILTYKKENENGFYRKVKSTINFNQIKISK